MPNNYILTSAGSFISCDELYHHGIKGQRWGVRRYQNENGSLTNAGKKRYYDTPELNTQKSYMNATSATYKNLNRYTIEHTIDIIMSQLPKILRL